MLPAGNIVGALIKYIKSVLWRAAKRLSYIKDARYLKVKMYWRNHILIVTAAWDRELRKITARILSGDNYCDVTRLNWKILPVTLEFRTLSFHVIPLGAWMSVSCECCALSGRGHCDGTIPRSEAPYLFCVCVCVCDCVYMWVSLSVTRWNSDPLHLK